MLPDSLSKYIGHSVQQQVATASSSQSSSNKIIYLGEVVNNIDSSKMGRIKVRLVTKDEVVETVQQYLQKISEMPM